MHSKVISSLDIQIWNVCSTTPLPRWCLHWKTAKDRGGQPCYDASTTEIPTSPRISFLKQALMTSHQIDCLVFEIKMPMGRCVRRGNAINSMEILLHTIGGCWKRWVSCRFYYQLPLLIPVDMNGVLHHWLEDMCREDVMRTSQQ